MTTWVAFDTETTGIEPGSRLLDLGAVAFDDAGEVVSTFEQLAHPGMPVPADATAVNGITDAMLAGQPPIADVLTAFLGWLPKRSTLIAHNAPYDCDILTWEFQHAGLPLPTQTVMDTCLMAKALRETPNNKLQTLIQHHRLRRVGSAHRALPDADAVRQYFTYARSRTVPSAMAWAGRYACPARLPAPLKQLPTWIAEAKRLRLRYTDARGEATTRELTPYGYATAKNGLMIHGWCHLAEARRTFAAERMTVIAGRR